MSSDAPIVFRTTFQGEQEPPAGRRRLLGEAPGREFKVAMMVWVVGLSVGELVG